MADPDLRQLMLDAEQQSSEVSSMGVSLPRLERNLRQVCEASRDLWSKLQQTAPVQGTEAHVLLGSKGVDLSQLSQKLESLSSRDMLAPLEPAPDTDINNFLKNEIHNTLLEIIERNRVDNFSDVERQGRAMLSLGWIIEKSNLLNLLTEESDDDSIMQALAESNMQITMRSEAPSTARSLMSSIEMAYANRFIEYNRNNLRGTSRGMLGATFRDTSLQFNDKKIPELWDCLNAMMHMPVELTTTTGDVIKCRNSPRIQLDLIKHARYFLQDRYKLYMESVVQKNLQRARTGGVPNTFALVRGFVALHETSGLVTEDGQVEEQPVWHLIYYCLRCGNAKAALFCAQQAGIQLQSFCPFLDEMAASETGEMSEKTVDNIRNQYRRIVASCSDSFKRAVYCLLGACDVREDFPEVLPTAEDYLWFKLGQIRVMRDQEDMSTSAPTDMLTYNHLQSLIVQEYGETYYNAKEKPYLYASMLILTGQFEAAIEFLMRTGTGMLKPHAVHMALALHETGLLATPATVQSPLLSSEDSDPSPSKRLNLARVILTYCTKFQQTNLREVLNYYYFLKDLTGPQGISLFKLSCCDLALETSAYSEILGSLADDGTRLNGLIDEFFTSADECKEVIRMVAEESEKKALLEHAVPLYELCGDHENALRILSSLLGQVLPMETHHDTQTDRDRLARAARFIERRYRGRHLNCASNTSNNFNLLCQLLDFFDLLHAKDYNAAKEVLMKTDLLPTKETEVDDYTKAFKELDDSIMRNFPDILLAAMKILCIEYTKVKTDSESSASRDQALEAIRKHAHAITAFSATLPYNMPGDTNSMLVQLMMRMN